MFSPLWPRLISCPGLPGTKTFLGPLDFQSPTRAIPGQLDRPIPHLCFGLLPHFLPFLSPTLPSPPLPSQVSLPFSGYFSLPSLISGVSHTATLHVNIAVGVGGSALRHTLAPQLLSAPTTPHPPWIWPPPYALSVTLYFRNANSFFFFLKINLSKLTVAGKAHLLPKNDIINSKAKKKEQKDVEKKATILL